MSYTGIPNFDDPMAKIRERIHWQSGARIVDILYGAKNPDGSLAVVLLNRGQSDASYALRIEGQIIRIKLPARTISTVCIV